MRAPPPCLRLWPTTILAITIFVSGLVNSSNVHSDAAAAVGKPIIETTKFDFLPDVAYYFEDTSTILTLNRVAGIPYISFDDGATWEIIGDTRDIQDQTLQIFMHPYDNLRAYIFGDDISHFYTNDGGKSWIKFTTHFPVTEFDTLQFNAANPDYLLVNCLECSSDNIFRVPICDVFQFYTEDNFVTLYEMSNVDSCIFARNSKTATAGLPETLICTQSTSSSSFSSNKRLVVSDDWLFTITEIKINGRELNGIVGLGSTQGYYTAAVMSGLSEELSMYVSDDSKVWARAAFPNQLKQGAYTLLRSTPHSIQVDVLNPDTRFHPTGDLFASNSNGTYFKQILKYVNRNSFGAVDYEQVHGMEGLAIANIASNGDELASGSLFDDVDKIIESRISFNEGRTWQPLKLKSTECQSSESSLCKVHLHSVTDQRQSGNIFSSNTPGLLVGIGNTGAELLDYQEGDMYVSDDAGQSWIKALIGPHKYEFGDQGSVIVAVGDKPSATEAKYSFDHGKTWGTIPFDAGISIEPTLLATTPDASSLSFIIVGFQTGAKSETLTRYVMSINLKGIMNRKCSRQDEDFEKWYALYDGNTGEPSCVMGHKQFFWRRKADAACFIGDIFHEPIIEIEACPCSKFDYECDYNYVDDGSGSCILAGPELMPDDACKNPGDTFFASSGYRLIPGNTCDRLNGEILDDRIVKNCDDLSNAPIPGQVGTISTNFDGTLRDFTYLESDDSGLGEKESLIITTSADRLFVSHDNGGDWKEVLPGTNVLGVYANPNFLNRLYILTTDNKIHYSSDYGKNFIQYDQPSHKSVINDPAPHLDFHKDKADYIIWVSQRDCSSFTSSPSDCKSASYFTKDGGETWKELYPNAVHCAWQPELGQSHENLILCTESNSASSKASSGDVVGGQRNLVASMDFFATSKVLLEDILDFATFEGFLFVAAKNPDSEDDSLEAKVSIDGETFADVKFPYNFQVSSQQAYTVLNSVSKAILLHVTVDSSPGHEYGSILKSNSNGTSYILSLANVNRNEVGFVDYDKLDALEGVAFANVVSNVNELQKGKSKKLRTYMTHNDGGQWELIRAPSKDINGKKYKCNPSKIDKCSLNLHGYTERYDASADRPSAKNAPGFVIGIGNVGDQLSSYQDSNTYLSTDGGITWKEVAKGPRKWKFGDQGSIIALVNDLEPTDTVTYSLDEGDSWTDLKFSEKLVNVIDIVTVPSDTSRRFIIFSKLPGVDGDKFSATQVDFAGLFSRQCLLDTAEPEDDDFMLWTPKHPLSPGNCLFGHETQYHRKIKGRDCFIGPSVPQPHAILRNCSCTRADFECDFNYARARDGTCQLVSGFTPPDHSSICSENPNQVQYWAPTGYRRIPSTTCQGGIELDKIEAKPCPGHEREFKNQRRGLHGFALAFVIILSIGLALCIVVIVHHHYSPELGQIRLGEDNASQIIPNGYLRYPLLGIAAGAAAIAKVPAFIGKTIRERRRRGGSGGGSIGGWFKRIISGITGRKSGWYQYRSRSSFARNNSGFDYTSVDEDDEGELLGLEEDDDAEEL